MANVPPGNDAAPASATKGPKTSKEGRSGGGLAPKAYWPIFLVMIARYIVSRVFEPTSITIPIRLQEADRWGQCRGSYQCGRFNRGRFKAAVTYPPPAAQARGRRARFSRCWSVQGAHFH
jgi:hypothetical protein